LSEIVSRQTDSLAQQGKEEQAACVLGGHIAIQNHLFQIGSAGKLGWMPSGRAGLRKEAFDEAAALSLAIIAASFQSCGLCWIQKDPESARSWRKRTALLLQRPNRWPVQRSPMTFLCKPYPG